MGMCKHCGGAVEADGFAKHMADGGEVDDESWESQMSDEMAGKPGARLGQQMEELEPAEGRETEQHAQADAHMDAAFYDAVKRMPRAKMTGGPDKAEMMSDGGEVEQRRRMMRRGM